MEKEMTNGYVTNGYAVIIQNGNPPSVDLSDIVVYFDKAEAEKNAHEVRESYGANSLVEVVSVVIKYPT